jgi:hypothetical protein
MRATESRGKWRRKAESLCRFPFSFRFFPFLSVTFCFFPFLSAHSTDFTTNAIGTAGDQFLLEPIGARGIAMGGAYTAVTDDATSLYWNPAGLSRVSDMSGSLMYTPYLAGINYQAAEVAKRVSDTDVVALGFRSQSYGSISQTDINGNSLGSFSPQDYVAEIGWGASIPDLSDNNIATSMGVSGRWIHSTIVQSANSYGGDFGVQTRIYHGDSYYDMGITAQNIGQGPKFDAVQTVQPFQLKVGGAMYPWKGVTLSLDMIAPEQNIVYGAAGVEYAIPIDQTIKVALRGGINTMNIESSDLGPVSMFSGGVGFSAGDVSFDYAFVPMAFLGNVSYLSLNFNLPSKSKSPMQP